MGQTGYRFDWDVYMDTVNACAKEAKKVLRRMEDRRVPLLGCWPPSVALAMAEGAVVEGTHELAEIKRMEWWLAGYIAQRSSMDAIGLDLRLP